MNLDSQERLAFVLEPGGRTRTATATCAHCKCAFSAHQKLHTDTWLPPLAETLASCAWRNDLTGSLVCSPSCADARVRQSSSLSYQVTGEEQERRQRAAGATNVHDRLAKASAAEMTARCVRCSAEMTLHVGTEAGTLKSLKALGWHALGNGWACSKLCKEWLAGPVAEDAVKPVTVLADAEYQRRRAQGGNPRLAALPDPAAKSKGAR